MTGSPGDMAAQWLTRRASGADIESDPAFTSWLSQSAGHAGAWAEAEHVWNGFTAEPDMLLEAMRQVALEARSGAAADDDEAGHENAYDTESEPGALKRPWRRWAVGVSAAAAAILLGVGTAWQQGWLGPTSPASELAAMRYASPIGQRVTVRLADASVVTLDSGSDIEVRMSPERRDVRLVHGQAYFSVVHDPRRPFTVEAAGSRVTDLGTEFDLLAKPDGLRVLVVRGSVAVDDEGVTQSIVAGEGYDSAPASRGRLRSPDLGALLAWKSGYLEFRNDRLSAAVADMNRYAPYPIIIADRTIGGLPVSGRFATGESERFARSLADIYGLRMSRGANGAIILRGGK